MRPVGLGKQDAVLERGDAEFEVGGNVLFSSAVLELGSPPVERRKRGVSTCRWMFYGIHRRNEEL